MRHFLCAQLLSLPVRRLPGGVLAPTPSRLLVAIPGLAQATPTNRLPTPSGAVAMATIAP